MSGWSRGGRGGGGGRSGAAAPQRLDLAIGRNGRIAAIAPALVAPEGVQVVDLDGKLVVPGLIDAHQHLDKALTRAVIANPDGTLAGAIAAFRDYAVTVTRHNLIPRAERTLKACLARGTVAVRTHANIDPQLEVRGVEALIELRERCAEWMTLQVVAFVTAEATSELEAAKKWLEAAIAAGADVVGGTPAISEAPLEFLDLLFAAAARHGLPLDLHLDEHLDPERHFFDAVIERTRAFALQGRVAAGHCSALSALAPDAARRVIDGFAEAKISVITLPSANLFLQGRSASALPPRGLTRVRELVAAGVPVAAASDNIQDPFVPIGSGDLLETARWTLLAGHLAANDLSTAFDMVTRTPAAIMGLGADWGIHEGARADLLITDAADPEDLVAGGSLARTVLVAGRPVAGGLQL